MGAGLGVRSILPTVREGALFREEEKFLRWHAVIPSRQTAFFLNSTSKPQVQSRLLEGGL
jgi:hypothetical protein